MPKVTIWIRVEDWELWKSIEDVPEFIHNAIREDISGGYTSGALQTSANLKKGIGVIDTLLENQKKVDTVLGTDLHPTTAARINPCKNPEPHIVGSLPCCAGIIFRPEPTVEPLEETS